MAYKKIYIHIPKTQSGYSAAPTFTGIFVG